MSEGTATMRAEEIEGITPLPKPPQITVRDYRDKVGSFREEVEAQKAALVEIQRRVDWYSAAADLFDAVVDLTPEQIGLVVQYIQVNYPLPRKDYTVTVDIERKPELPSLWVNAKEAIIRLLQDADGGLTQEEIISQAKERYEGYGKNFPRQLIATLTSTRHKDGGPFCKVGGRGPVRWRLRKHWKGGQGE